MAGAVAIGAVGLLGGAWQASMADPACVAGLVGGAITLSMGCFGLHILRRGYPPSPGPAG